MAQGNLFIFSIFINCNDTDILENLCFFFLMQVVPTGFANLLRWCKSSYNDPPIYITENGFSDLPGTLEDYGRISYFNVSIFKVFCIFLCFTPFDTII